MTTTGLPDERVEIYIVHPFSPLKGKKYEVIEHMTTWGEDRVLCMDEHGETHLFMTSWTDYLPEDPFITISDRTVDFRYEDLKSLSQLLRAIKDNK